MSRVTRHCTTTVQSSTDQYIHPSIQARVMMMTRPTMMEPCTTPVPSSTDPSSTDTVLIELLLRISYLEHKTSDWVQNKISFIVGPQTPPLAIVKRRKLHGSGTSHVTTASPKPSFRAPWRLDDAMVGRGTAGRTTSNTGYPCLCQSCSHGPPAEKTERGSLLNRP